jgi:tetrachlorobenzoquinone reductase
MTAEAMTQSSPLDLRVHAITFEAEGVLTIEFRDPLGRPLPRFSAGAHIDVALPNGISRSYSLINPQTESDRYVIGVGRDPASGGGSAYLCETLRPGQMLPVASPRNTFALVEDAPLSVLIAGGIGITPIWSMVRQLESLGRPWRLYFATKTRRQAAFLAPILELEKHKPGRVVVTFDHEPGGAMLDIPAIIAGCAPQAHLYCCGPSGMLRAFEVASAARPPSTVHMEFFTSDQARASGGFEVVLARSGKTVQVAPGQSILDALLAEGLQLAYSCREGVCGTCETEVLEGLPDHRDAVLSKRERDSNRNMMICVSGCLNGRLVLGL